MSDPLARVRARLQELGLPDTIRFFPEGTGSSEEAARAVGCSVAQIAKTVVFADAAYDPLLVIASGAHRVDTRRLGVALSTKLRSVGREYLVDRLGMEPGTVTPLAIEGPTRAVMDNALLSFDRIWLAAGTASHVMSISPRVLAERLQMTVLPVA
jgi:prolyl-tRNA editing enzyme YbaK/EbsC (Cys-tRNA(Pro) deacylase)